MSKKIEKIRILTKEALKNTIYDKDYKLSKEFIFTRKFESLLDLLKSIIKKEERKPKSKRLVNIHLIIEAISITEDYLEQLQYNIETDGQFEDY